MDRTLIFTTCYNERANIGQLLDEIVAAVPHADILVVDDNSPDGTWQVLEEKQRVYPQLRCVKRPRKLGIGSAHKYALFHAMREGYATLVTMDADFSHSPAAIPTLLAAHGPGTFVTGSRYCAGGRSDYTGYRNIVSRLGNVAARAAVGVRLRELTTYFRVFDVATLRRLPLRAVAASGYSYGVELIHCLHRSGVTLREVPIHFVDRTRGASKIPRMQVLFSALDLLGIVWRRVLGREATDADVPADDACVHCGDRVLAMRHFGRVPTAADATTPPPPDAYRCTAVGTRRQPPVYVCLACGLEQVPAHLVPPDLETSYAAVVDPTYLDNAGARRRTYAHAFDRIAPHLPATPGRLLDVGAYCGLFMAEAQRRGWHATGIEPSAWAAAPARDVEGQDVLVGDLDSCRDRLTPPYDLVTAWDVLEHVRDPHRFLAGCARLLGTGGTLCLSTLDVAAPYAQAMGSRWPWLMDMHIVYFDRDTVTDMLSHHGLELLDVLPHRHYARVAYALRGLAPSLPRPAAALLRGMAGIVPSRILVPVSLGDIKLFIARKR